MKRPNETITIATEEFNLEAGKGGNFSNRISRLSLSRTGELLDYIIFLEQEKQNLLEHRLRIEETFIGGAGAIASERVRQIEKEGWTPDHDDALADYGLTKAALCYAHTATLPVAPAVETVLDFLRKYWPWTTGWWKPSLNRKRNIEKAGALLAAEWDRLDRIEKGESSPL